MKSGLKRSSNAMKELLKERQIYDNKDLQQFILQLECRYEIKNLTSKYCNSVNFSENENVPFHQWFRYREGFSGNLIKELISDSGATKKEVIIDPFSGSGTTPVVAVLNGYTGLGIDINPMSVFIANVKMQQYTQSELQLCKITVRDLPEVSISNLNKYDVVRKYFKPRNFEVLCGLKDYIDGVDDIRSRSILMTAFLCIIEDCSNRRRDGNGLKTVSTKVSDVRDVFIKKALEILSDLETTSCNLIGKGECIADSATNLYQIYKQYNGSGNLKVGTIIFSPPYPNSFDYFESYKLELILGDFAASIKGINDFRQHAVRSFIGAKEQQESDKYINIIAEEIQKAIPEKEAKTGKKDLRTRKVPNMIKGYFSDMQEIIRQCGLCLEKGKKIYIVIDQSSYVGIIVPTDLLLAYLAEQVGFKVESIIECRKCRTSAQQLQRFPYLKNVLRESILELVKE
jgi:site-specific DNA-methyltransferase (adenine-specific)